MNSEFGVRDGERGRGRVEMLPEPVGFATRWWCWKTSEAKGAGAVNDVTPRGKTVWGEKAWSPSVSVFPSMFWPEGQSRFGTPRCAALGPHTMNLFSHWIRVFLSNGF